MSFRDFLSRLEKEGKLVKIKKPVSTKFEASGILKALDGKPVLFEKIKESPLQAAGNICASRDLIADYLGCRAGDLVKKMMHAIDHPSKPEPVSSGACQEIVEGPSFVEKLPLLTHCEHDGGPYVSSGIFFVRDPEKGRNISFHRMMHLGGAKFAVRILERHLDAFIKRAGGEIDAAVCIGNAPNVLLAGATSVALGSDELEIANSLAPLKTVKAKSIDVEIPADTEIVLEGRITKELHSEGKFVDLTETYDIVRQQQVFEVKKVTMRKNAVYQALLPGALEHKMLMGMPREPTIFREVSKACECKDVYITPGGASWLHAVVQIKKKDQGDGAKAIEAAFKGHHSLKHCIIVDEDIDLRDPESVEWAIATRFQATRAVIKHKEKGSSLDPSADPDTRETTKVGIDATIPLGSKGKGFNKAEFPKVDLKKFLE